MDDVDAFLAEIRARAQAATHGPWLWDVSYTYDDEGDNLRLVTHGGDDNAICVVESDVWPDGADAAFIANARTDVEVLLDALQAVLKSADDYGDVGVGMAARHYVRQALGARVG